MNSISLSSYHLTCNKWHNNAMHTNSVELTNNLNSSKFTESWNNPLVNRHVRIH